MPSSLNGTGITFSNASTQSVAWPGNTGTVTSVATGNGLSGGTITSTGTLVIACPTYQSIGSYVYGRVNATSAITSGQTIAGSSVQIGNSWTYDPCIGYILSTFGALPGTWRFMAGTAQNGTPVGIFCRIS